MSESSKTLTKIGKYEIKRRIGRGAMGVVYEAFDPFAQHRIQNFLKDSFEGFGEIAIFDGSIDEGEQERGVDEQ